METCSSGEELTVKVRKPYTITKQRERWTDEEHNRFLEALKLYGRAWQRIEEHIGTKTAVQIRSHAQKFFTKLEKEALSKGIPLEQALDIDIPPPRPKRKPSNPYPRKACMGTSLSSKEVNDKNEFRPITTTCQNKTLNLKKCAQLEKMAGVESSERAEDNSENGKCSVVLTLFGDAPCVSVSSEKKSFATPQNFKKFEPFLKDGKHKAVKEKSSLTAKENEELTQCTADSTDMDISRIEGLHKNPQKKEVPRKSIGHKQPQEGAIASNCELQGTAKHAGFYSKEENNANSGQCANPNPSNAASIPSSEEVPVYPIPPFNNPSFTARTEQYIHPVLSSFHPELPTFPSCTLLQNNQETPRSLLNISSTFSNFIMSSLLQNPAAHAAACLAASFWPSLDEETVKSEAEALNCQAPTGQVNASPSMAAVAAATVAAATAWWATHGQFPFCYPLISNGLFFASPPPATGPTTTNNQSPVSSAARQVDHAQLHKLQDEHVLNLESPDDLVMQCSCSKPLALASSNSDGSGGEKPVGTVLNDSDVKDLDGGFHNYVNKTKNFKNIDSCFCGSNRSSSKEKEIKIVLEKDGNKEADKLASFSKTNKDPEEKASFSETNCCRFRSSGSVRESWKEVSEEGRLAFQALFSREVLPQSFLPAEGEDGTTNLDERIATYSPVNLKSNVSEDIVLDPFPSSESSSSRSNNHSDKSILTHDYGCGKLKCNQTGFKPYKRCSMEVKEGRASAADDKRNKRSRLAGEASSR